MFYFNRALCVKNGRASAVALDNYDLIGETSSDTDTLDGHTAYHVTSGTMQSGLNSTGVMGSTPALNILFKDQVSKESSFDDSHNSIEKGNKNSSFCIEKSIYFVSFL